MEIIVVIDYDNVLKQLVYYAFMFIEIAVKNFALEQIVTCIKGKLIDDICVLNDELSNSVAELLCEDVDLPKVEHQNENMVLYQRICVDWRKIFSNIVHFFAIYFFLFQ